MLPVLAGVGLAHSALGLVGGVGVEGFESFAASLLRFGVRLASHARRVDESILDEMVRDARAAVPRDTGLLFAGIKGERVDGFFEFSASAEKPDGADYARFVEYGTRAGARGQSVAYQSRVGSGGGLSLAAEETSAFASRRRRQYRSHPGTKAQPFFYPSARAALEKRGLSMADVARQAAADADLGD